MARAKGMLNLSGNIEVLAGAPFDAREVVPTKADLTTASNFPYPYIGMETYVTAENKKYRYVGGDITQEASWEELGEGGGGGSYSAGDGIDITNDVISVDEMAAEDMEEIATPKPSVMSRRFKYSTDEQIVGEWIDGSLIYQKVVTGLNFTPTQYVWSATGVNIPNCDRIIHCEFAQADGNSTNFINVALCKAESNGNISAWFPISPYTYEKMLINYTKTA